MSIAESADAGCALESHLRLELDQAVDVPHVESLFELRSLCQPGKSDAEFWQLAVAMGAKDLCQTQCVGGWEFALTALENRRYFEWDQQIDFDQAEAAICGEINQFLNRLLNGDSVVTKTKPKPKAEPEQLMTLEDDEPVASTSKIEHVRESEFAALKRAGKSRAKEPKTIPTGPAPGGLNVFELPLHMIVDSPFQTREEPSDESIDRLVASFTKDGQRDPIRVRAVGSKFELIAGHRRFRAAQRLKWIVILAVELQADDAEAARLVFDDNEQREDLNQIERAKSLLVIWERYQAAGKTQTQMAEDLGIEDQSTISNRLRILKAPAALQQRLISGEIGEWRVRELAKWAKYDKLIQRFEKELNLRCSKGPISNDHWTSSLRIAIEANSKPISTSDYHGEQPLFKCSDRLDELDFVEVKLSDGSVLRRAMNVKRWKELQAPAKQRKQEREKAKAAKATEPSKQKERHTDQKSWNFMTSLREAWSEPLWQAIGEAISGKLNRTQQTVVARLVPIIDGNCLPMEILTTALSMTQVQWEEECVKHLREEWSDGMPYDMRADQLAPIAEYFGIDGSSNWKPSAALLRACEPIDLREFAAELNVEQSLAKDQLVEMLVECWRPGWVPELFVIEEPKPKKKGRR